VEDNITSKLRDYELAKQLAGPEDDIQFIIMMVDYLKLTPEERLALGLARGRRKYFIIRK
jgi:hypothetical protein